MDRGEVPGYEFEPRGPRQGSGPPRYEFVRDPRPEFERDPREYDPRQGGPRSEFERSPRSEFERDPVRQFRREERQAPKPPVVAAGSGILSVMRGRNWIMGLAVPVVAAVAVGIAVVVVTGGGGSGSAAPSALAAGFPPARLAGATFTGTGTSRVFLTAIGASSGTEVAAGGVNGGPALWSSSDGGAAWTRAALGGRASLTGAGTGQLAAVAHGPAGWLAVGTTLAGKGGPLVASSPDGRKWTAAGGIARNAVAAGVAAGRTGSVIVGHKSLGGSDAEAAAWYASGLTGWRTAAIAAQGQPGGQMMNAVTVTARGFLAVGAQGTTPAAWLSATGRSWQPVTVALPADAARAALDYVAANGSAVVAAGTKFSATGVSSPFAEVSADAGATWTQVQLPVPTIGPGTGTTVTALTAAGGGFTAAGTYVTQAGPEVVVWTLPAGTPVTDGAAWAAATPQGEGLANGSSENAITGLAADGATLTGVGFTAGLAASGMPGAQEPTLWQSPIR